MKHPLTWMFLSAVVFFALLLHPFLVLGLFILHRLTKE